MQMLGLMEESPQPSHFAVVFDARGKNFRCGQRYRARSAPSLLWRPCGCVWFVAWYLVCCAVSHPLAHVEY